MKAFQLKIAIKNSKPPIWRRIVVPAGITFSQLSIILNEAMGWSGYHLFDYEFYHLELRITEDAEEYAGGYGPFDYLEASTTYIREYLEENEWFTYTYDLGDNWQHRVTVEKVIEDYEPDYAQVLKFKGDCPPEDCGGIYGYYELMGILEDETHPEHEERKEWLGTVPCEEYDMELVNQNLREQYFYQWGKGETRSQQEIYREVFSGKCGLLATKKDKNKALEIHQSSKHRMEDSLQQIADLIKQKIAMENQTKNYLAQNNTLADMLEDYEKVDLLEIAKEKGVKGISGATKKQLVTKIAAAMLESETMKKYFSYQTDVELRDFERVIEENGYCENAAHMQIKKLYEAGYMGMLTNGVVTVPKDIIQKYQAIRTAEFEQLREKNSYILCCLETAKRLYGIVPLSVFADLLKTNVSTAMMSEVEIKQAIEELPVEYAEYVVKGNNIYHVALVPNDRGLLNAQGAKKYYIPNREEILSYGVYGYLPEIKELGALKQFLRKRLDLPEEEAEYVVALMQIRISGDCTMDEVFEILEEEEIYLANPAQMKQLIELVNDLWNNTRMLLNRGFTPNELAAMSRNKPFAIPMEAMGTPAKIISFDEARKNKIYPNAPCPCGSGKKYKNCCKGK